MALAAFVMTSTTGKGAAPQYKAKIEQLYAREMGRREVRSNVELISPNEEPSIYLSTAFKRNMPPTRVLVCGPEGLSEVRQAPGCDRAGDSDRFYPVHASEIQPQSSRNFGY